MAGKSSTSEGTCRAHPTCKPDQYLAGSPTLLATAAGTCVSCSNLVCPVGQYRAGTCSGTNNGFQCKVCAKADCPAGQTRGGKCGGTVNSFTCTACPNLQYKTSLTSCAAKRVASACGINEKFVPGMNSQKTADDTTCAECSSGEWKIGPTMCKVKRSVCPPGEKFVPGSNKQKTADDTTCVTCPDNTYKPQTDSATACLEQQQCGAGEAISADSKASVRTCAPCAAGTFLSLAQHRLEQCTTWSECSKDGQFEFAKPTAATDRKCGRNGVCIADEFESQAPTPTSARMCQELSICGKGQFAAVSATATTDLACGACGNHTYQALNSSRADVCTPQTTCGERERISPDSKVDARVCESCPDGEYQSDKGHRNMVCSAKQATCPEGMRLKPGTDEVLFCYISIKLLSWLYMDAFSGR